MTTIIVAIKPKSFGVKSLARIIPTTNSIPKLEKLLMEFHKTPLIAFCLTDISNIFYTTSMDRCAYSSKYLPDTVPIYFFISRRGLYKNAGTPHNKNYKDKRNNCWVCYDPVCQFTGNDPEGNYLHETMDNPQCDNPQNSLPHRPFPFRKSCEDRK